MNLRKKITSVAVAAALVAGAGVANAAVIAQSTLLISNFTFSSDGSALDLSDFTFLTYSDSTDAAATLNGVTDSGSLNSSTFGALDLLQQCVGDCSFGQNDYSSHLAPTTTVARGDTYLVGSPISGTSQALGATANTLAEAQLISSGDGSTQSNLGLITTFAFAFADDKTVDLSFDATIHLIASLSADAAIPGSNTQASANWSLSVVDQFGEEVFSWDPQGGAAGEDCDLNRTVATQVPGLTRTYDCTGSFSRSVALVGGVAYELNLRHTSTADATNLIPEPGSLALFGMGLAGLGFVRRRKA